MPWLMRTELDEDWTTLRYSRHHTTKERLTAETKPNSKVFKRRHLTRHSVIKVVVH